MKRKLTICLLIALIFYNGNAKAAERGSLEELNDLSDTVFQMTDRRNMKRRFKSWSILKKH